MKKAQDNANAVRRMAGQAATIDRVWQRVGVPRRFKDMRLHDSPAPEYALSMLFTTECRMRKHNSLNRGSSTARWE